jgi:5'-nucleotidase
MTKFGSIAVENTRLLLSNDDGIAAPGLKVLERIARVLSKDVWIAAPETEQSGAGHSLSLRRPLRLRRLAARRFAIDGTPTDAVLLAVHEVLKKKLRPALMLSGVNRGSNLGEDVTYSGTIAAAMEATLLGIPAIAFSLAFNDPTSIQWKTAEAHGPDLIRRLTRVGWPEDVLINVNFPDCSPDQVRGVRIARQGKRKLVDQVGQRVDMRGEHYYWIGPMRQDGPQVPGSDLAAVLENFISVTPLSLDLTHDPTLRALAGAFSTPQLLKA